MAKISDLPELANPTGAENVVVQDGGTTRRVPVGGLARAAVAPHVAAAAASAASAKASADSVKSEFTQDNLFDPAAVVDGQALSVGGGLDPVAGWGTSGNIPVQGTSMHLR